MKCFLLFAVLLVPVLHAQGPVRAEPGVPGFTRENAETLALVLPPDPINDNEVPDPLEVHDFSFNGQPVDTSRLHLRQLGVGVVEVTSEAGAVGAWHFSIIDTSDIYGLGERFNSLDHSHEVVRNISVDNPAAKGSTAYKPVPFFMSTNGWGLWLDTTGAATFDFNASDRDTIEIDATAGQLRVVLFYGTQTKARLPALLSAFTGVAGRPAHLPPYWAFAPWITRDYAQHTNELNQADVLETADRMRALGLPASVIVLDDPWQTAENSFRFNTTQFADAPGMVKRLHQGGYKLLVWTTPWINVTTNPPLDPDFAGKALDKSPNYDEAAREGFFLKKEDGTPYVGPWWQGVGSAIDFTNPRAKLWWQGQLKLALDAGADGFKDDDGEGAFPVGVKFADGTDRRLMRNRFGVLYNNAVEETIERDLKGNGVLFARSVTTGALGLGFLWGGDNESNFSVQDGLPASIVGGLSAGLSGMPLWASDLAGYFAQEDSPDPLLYQRWTEFSAFSPVMEVTSTDNLTPWTFDKKAGGTAALDTYRKFAVLHMSLFPYRYAAAQEAMRTGQPILRALALDFQDDVRAKVTRDEYLFGPDLLVAPVIDENTSRVVYLPKGEWINLFTGEAVVGPKAMIVQAPPDSIPVFARRGTILPKIPEDVMTLVPVAESGNREVHGLDDRRVYEILGSAAAGPTTLTDFEGRVLVRDGSTLTIVGKPARVMVRWKFQDVRSASVDGRRIEIVRDASGGASVAFELRSKATVSWQ